MSEARMPSAEASRPCPTHAVEAPFEMVKGVGVELLNSWVAEAVLDGGMDDTVVKPKAELGALDEAVKESDKLRDVTVSEAIVVGVEMGFVVAAPFEQDGFPPVGRKTHPFDVVHQLRCRRRSAKSNQHYCGLNLLGLTDVGRRLNGRDGGMAGIRHNRSSLGVKL